MRPPPARARQSRHAAGRWRRPPAKRRPGRPPPPSEASGLRSVHVNERPVGVAALKIALKRPDFSGAPIIDRLALRTLGAAAELRQEPDRRPGQVADQVD